LFAPLIDLIIADDAKVFSTSLAKVVQEMIRVYVSVKSVTYRLAGAKRQPVWINYFRLV